MTPSKGVMSLVIGTYLVGFVTLGYFIWRLSLWVNWHYGYEERVRVLIHEEMKR